MRTEKTNFSQKDGKRKFAQPMKKRKTPLTLFGGDGKLRKMKQLSWGITALVLVITAISVSNNRESDIDFLEDQLISVADYFEERDLKNEEVSQADVAWHLDHILKTINRLTDALVASDPKEYKASMNFQRILVHTTGFIPRGEAQSPASVRPPNVILLDSLYWQLERTKVNLDLIATLDENAHFAHPVFGSLDRDQTRRFIEIHTNHHLKIIRDILGE